MIGVITGFAIVAAVIAAGYVVGRTGVLGPHADFVLGRIAFFVLSPPLLFIVLARSDVHHLFSTQLPVAALSALAMFAVYVAVARLVWRRPVAETVIGAMGSGYQNANNIGLPLSLYVLGDAAASAPIIMLQLVAFGPVALTVLDVATGDRRSAARTLTAPLRNPMLIAAALGVLVAFTGWTPPDGVMAPLDLVGGAAVPVLLLNFGLSLAGGRALAPGPDRGGVLLASALKLVAMPLTAWVFARFVFGMDGHALFAAVVLAALPSAQNVYNYAQRYGRGLVLARDTVLITTVGSLPVLVAIAWLLGD